MNQTSPEDKDWEKILKLLTVYANNEIKKYNWYLGKDQLPKGFSAYDLALETIKSYLDNPEKFDPSRNNDLLKYLKYGILRRLISNLAKSGENKTSTILDEDLYYQLTYTLHVESDIDVDQAVQQIRNSLELENEQELLDLFEVRYDMHYFSRKEICEFLGISPVEYTNRLKRLQRRVEKIIKQFNLSRRKNNPS